MTSDTAKSMLIIAGCSEEDNSDFSQLYGEDYNVVFADNAEAVIFSVWHYYRLSIPKVFLKVISLNSGDAKAMSVLFAVLFPELHTVADRHSVHIF